VQKEFHKQKTKQAINFVNVTPLYCEFKVTLNLNTFSLRIKSTHLKYHKTRQFN